MKGDIRVMDGLSDFSVPWVLPGHVDLKTTTEFTCWCKRISSLKRFHYNTLRNLARIDYSFIKTQSPLHHWYIPNKDS
jgi:hypothetical protein